MTDTLYAVYLPDNGEDGHDWIIVAGDPMNGTLIAWCPTREVAQWIVDHSTRSDNVPSLTINLTDASDLAGLRVLALAKWAASPAPGPVNLVEKLAESIERARADRRPS